MMFSLVHRPLMVAHTSSLRPIADSISTWRGAEPAFLGETIVADFDLANSLLGRRGSLDPFFAGLSIIRPHTWWALTDIFDCVVPNLTSLIETRLGDVRLGNAPIEPMTACGSSHALYGTIIQ